MTVKAVVFDFSLTLIKTKGRLYRYIQNEIVKRFGDIVSRKLSDIESIYESTRKEKYDLGIEVHPYKWIVKVLEILDVEPTKELLEEILDKAEERYMKDMVVFDDVLPTLNALKEMDITMAVLSNMPDGDLVRKSLNRLKLSHFFTYVVTSFDINMRKPLPDVFKYIIDRLEIPSKNVLMVGDQLEDDIWGANMVGAKTALIERNVQKDSPIVRDAKIYKVLKKTAPTYRIKSLTEIIDIIKKGEE